MKGIVKFLNKNKEIIESVSIIKLPFKRELIIKTSIEIYDEEDPCIIYSTYCNQILGNRLLDKLNELYSSLSVIEFDISTLPEFLAYKLDLNNDVYFIRFE